MKGLYWSSHYVCNVRSNIYLKSYKVYIQRLRKILNRYMSFSLDWDLSWGLGFKLSLQRGPNLIRIFAFCCNSLVLKMNKVSIDYKHETNGYNGSN